MNDKMNQLIYKQDQYGINLAGNNDFCIWAHNDRYGMNTKEEELVSEKDAKLPAKECLWPEALSEFSEPTNEPIRSVESYREAVANLFWFRVGFGLEYAAMCRRELSMMWIDPSSYETCSETTQDLAGILVNY